MPTILKLKNSVTTTAAPTTLVQGEAAVNIIDRKVWVGDAASSPVQIVGAGAPVAGTTLTMTADGTFSGTGQLKVPAGTTAQRSGSPTAGMIRYNSSTGTFEGYTTAWGSIGGGATGATAGGNGGSGGGGRSAAGARNVFHVVSVTAATMFGICSPTKSDIAASSKQSSIQSDAPRKSSKSVFSS
jgi:hypothetical protein